MIKKLLIHTIVLVVVACSAKMPQTRLNDIGAIERDEVPVLIEKFNKKLSDEIKAFNQVSFNFVGKDISVFSISHVNTKKKDFKTAAFNSMGATLFKLNIKSGAITDKSFVPKVKKLENIISYINSDIQKIYFDNELSAGSFKIRVYPEKVELKRHENKGDLIYIYSGNPLRLVEKKFCINGKCLWLVKFYDYDYYNNKYFYKRVFFKNLEHNYSIKIKMEKVE